MSKLEDVAILSTLSNFLVHRILAIDSKLWVRDDMSLFAEGFCGLDSSKRFISFKTRVRLTSSLGRLLLTRHAACLKPALLLTELCIFRTSLSGLLSNVLICFRPFTTLFSLQVCCNRFFLSLSTFRPRFRCFFSQNLFTLKACKNKIFFTFSFLISALFASFFCYPSHPFQTPNLKKLNWLWNVTN